jgi:hypothetical protein
MDSSSQFHALPEELVQFVREQVAEFGLRVATVRHFPYRMEELDTKDLLEAFADPTVYSLVLAVPPLVAPVNDLNDLLQKNPGALLLDIGRRTENGLRESWIRARASAPDVVKVWKKIFSRFKRVTRAGATAINPATGATSRARDHRYTEGAMALNREGVAMLPMAGTAILRLG